ncbi:hypothetical protein KR032_006030, partial [Drosophila birchii]
MNMSGHGLCSIEKLDEENYAVWSVQMKSILVQSDLWPIVCGRTVKNEGDSQEQNALFDTRDEKALASILLGVKSSQINFIKNCTSSKEAWEKLMSVYQPRGPARKIALFKRLLRMSLL